MDAEINIHNNEQIAHFETKLDDGEYAFIEYRMYEGNMALMHTFVPDGHEGKGIAAALAKYALDHIRSKNIKAIVYCPYISVYLKRHPEYNDIIEKIMR